MAHMGQGPSHDVAYIKRGGAFPSLQHPVCELTPSEQLHKVSLSPEGLPRLGCLLQCPPVTPGHAYLMWDTSMKLQGPDVE